MTVSRNDIFDTVWTVAAPALPHKAYTAASADLQPSLSQDPLVMSMAKQSERAPIIHSDSAYTSAHSVRMNSAIAVILHRHWLIGNGRHAQVCVAQYQHLGQSWRICAAKMLSPDREAQVAGLNEAYLLGRLRHSPNIASFIALKDQPVDMPRRPHTDQQPMIGGRRVSRTLSAAGGASVPQSILSVHTRHLSLDSAIHTELSAPDLNTEIGTSSSIVHSLPLSSPDSTFVGTADSVGSDISPPSRLIVLTELYELGNLAQFVLAHGSHVLGQKLFMQWAKDLIRGIAAAHAQNVIHGDIKPQNCFIGRDFRLRIGDFSSSVLQTSISTAADGVAIGTTHYTPPELCTSEPTSFTPSVDVFSAALTLLYMISGYEPYQQLLTSDADHDAPGSYPSRRNNRRLRVSTSSQTIEMHSHIRKGDAWEWEERRRLAQAADTETDKRRLSRSSKTVTKHINARIPLLNQMDTTQLAYEEISIAIPSEYIDNPPAHLPAAAIDTYPGTRVLIQTFLTGTHTVPPDLRRLIQLMASPDPCRRPTAMQVLDHLEQI